MGDISVDIIVLTRDNAPIHPPVLTAIRQQTGIQVHVHRVIGTPRTTDHNRWQTIARARNVGRTLGDTPWVMFVDDDVVLGKDCIATLLEEIQARKPRLAAVGADYLGQRKRKRIAKHVAMGATLFRRDVLAETEFRWETQTCECQCMTDDLRKVDFEIDYSEKAQAVHLDRDKDMPDTCTHPVTEATTESQAPGDSANANVAGTPRPIILTAFNRSHMGLFAGQFVRTLRASGNADTVHAVAYGLRAKDVRSLERLPGVKVHALPDTAEPVCAVRMSGFPSVLKSVCPKTPVAYWDAGDVIFQGPLEPLWKIVSSSPDKLLVVEEPKEYVDNIGQRRWIHRIQDPHARAETFELLRGKRVGNGGFMAGRAGRLEEHFRSSYRLATTKLRGAGGGDQVVLNAMMYKNPDDYQVIDETWNYCLGGRSGKKCKIRKGRYLDVLANQAVRTIRVVHGNAATLHI